jgi:hypothetical protein
VAAPGISARQTPARDRDTPLEKPTPNDAFTCHHTVRLQQVLGRVLRHSTRVANVACRNGCPGLGLLRLSVFKQMGQICCQVKRVFCSTFSYYAARRLHYQRRAANMTHLIVTDPVSKLDRDVAHPLSESRRGLWTISAWSQPDACKASSSVSVTSRLVNDMNGLQLVTPSDCRISGNLAAGRLCTLFN